MADILQMSFPEMEALASAFTKASGDLDGLNSNIANFLSDIGAKVDEWKTRTDNLGQQAESTESELTSVKNNTRTTWQGAQADRFDGTYDSVQQALKKFRQELENFATTISKLHDNLEPTLTSINGEVKSGSDECVNQSQWISNYKAQHEALEG